MRNPVVPIGQSMVLRLEKMEGAAYLMLETGNSTVTPVVRNLRIDPAEQSPH